MNFIFGLILGIIIGGGLVYLSTKVKGEKKESKDSKERIEDYIDMQIKEKEKNIQKLSEYLKSKSKDDKITNSDIEKLLKISDATATRYLQDFEEEGKIKQVGQTGHMVFYKKT